MSATSENYEYSPSALQMFGAENTLTMKRIDAAVSVLGITGISADLKDTAEKYLKSQLASPSNPFVTANQLVTEKP